MDRKGLFCLLATIAALTTSGNALAWNPDECAGLNLGYDKKKGDCIPASSSPPQAPAPNVTSGSSSQSGAQAGAKAGASATGVGIGGGADVSVNIGVKNTATGGAGGSGTSSADSRSEVSNSGNGGGATINQGSTTIKSGAVAYSATPPPTVVGGMIGVIPGDCIPAKDAAGNIRFDIVGDEKWYYGSRTINVAGNTGTSSAQNIGAGGWPFTAQAGKADGNNAPGWAELRRDDCVVMKQKIEIVPPPPVSQVAPETKLKTGEIELTRRVARSCYKVDKDHPVGNKPIDMRLCSEKGGVRTWTEAAPGPGIAIITEVETAGGKRFIADPTTGQVTQRSDGSAQVIAGPTAQPPAATATAESAPPQAQRSRAEAATARPLPQRHKRNDPQFREQK